MHHACSALVVAAGIATLNLACGPRSARPLESSSDREPVVQPRAEQQRTWLADTELDELVERARVEHRLPALAAAVTTRAGLVAAAARGVSRVGQPDSVHVGDAFHLGSCTKAMTATLAAILVDEGRLAFDTPLSALPGLDEISIHAGYAGATLLDLLRHRAGLPANVPDDADAALPAKVTPREARRRLATAMLGAPPAGHLGQFEYSNAGYIVVGVILESAAAADWETLMRTRLFEPLGMRSCGFGPPQTVWGHLEDGGRPVAVPPTADGADNPAYLGPAGTVHCDVRDWARFGSLHLRTDRDEPGLVSSEQLEVLHEPVGSGDEAYAAGWIRPQPGLLAHDGSNTMWYASIRLMGKADLGLLFVANTGDAASSRAAFDLVTNELVARYLAHARAKK